MLEPLCNLRTSLCTVVYVSSITNAACQEHKLAMPLQTVSHTGVVNLLAWMRPQVKCVTLLAHIENNTMLGLSHYPMPIAIVCASCSMERLS